MPTTRDYTALLTRSPLPDSATLIERMQWVVDLLWEAFHQQGVSWVGFYLDHPEALDDARMTLGPRRDTPACSPIGLHGACGRVLLSGRPLIVHDVAELGANYIACDPRDRSEIVLPIFDDTGRVIAVLDLDSWDIGSFTEADADGLRAVLHHAGLHAGLNADH